MDADAIKKSYIDFINQNTHVPKIKGQITEVNTPFVNSTGEGISFDIITNQKSFTITDNGYTLWDMDLMGINLKRKSKRKDLFMSQIRYYGFELNDENQIFKKTTKSELGQSIHDMTQLLISIYDLTYLSKANVYQQFFEDVKNYFNENTDKYIYLPAFNISGKSHLNHRFDYAFHKDKKTKLVKVYNKITKSQIESILASWLDTTEVRKFEYNDNEELRIIVSDEGYKDLSDDHMLALEAYNIKVVNFDDKEKIEQEFAA